MSKTETGVFLFNEWLEAMSDLPANDFKKLVCAIYDYQLYGKQPPEFKGKTAIVSTIVFPCVNRRVTACRAGKLGAKARYYDKQDS